MVKRYEHRHGGMMPVNREVDTYVSSSNYAKLETERDALREALERGRLAIGEHSAPEECYATGPLTGCAIQDLIVCPACAFIDAYDDLARTASGGG